MSLQYIYNQWKCQKDENHDEKKTGLNTRLAENFLPTLTHSFPGRLDDMI